jgi:hypothetical protein
MKFRWLGLGASLALFSLGSLVACSSSSSGPKYPDTASFCSAWATEECQVAARCAVPSANCTSARQADCQTFASTATADLTRTYNSGNAEACIDKIHDLYSSAASGTAITPPQMADMADVCNRTFSGNVQSLKACTSNYDCSGSLICDKNFCANSTTKNLGDPCGDPGDVCASGAFCSTPAGSTLSQCVAEGAQGAACSAAAPCQPSLRCANTCGPLLQAGTLCATDADCDPSAPYCDPNVGNKCDQGLSFAAGAPACSTYGGT